MIVLLPVVSTTCLGSLKVFSESEKWENPSFYPLPRTFWTYIRGALHWSTFNLRTGWSNWNDIEGPIYNGRSSFLKSSNPEARARQREARTASVRPDSSPHWQVLWPRWNIWISELCYVSCHHLHQGNMSAMKHPYFIFQQLHRLCAIVHGVLFHKSTD